jgi:hypothetical protein
MIATALDSKDESLTGFVHQALHSQDGQVGRGITSLTPAARTAGKAGDKSVECDERSWMQQADPRFPSSTHRTQVQSVLRDDAKSSARLCGGPHCAALPRGNVDIGQFSSENRRAATVKLGYPDLDRTSRQGPVKAESDGTVFHADTIATNFAISTERRIFARWQGIRGHFLGLFTVPN